MKKYLILIALLSTAIYAAIDIDVDSLQSPDHTKIWSMPAISDTLVGRSTADVLTNKTLTGNEAANFLNGGSTITLPTSPSTLATLALAETLSNKTIQTLQTPEQEDSAATGSNATLAAPTSSGYKITNASLVSVDGIAGGQSGLFLVLQNKTGTSILINNNTGTSANRIITGTSADLTLAVDASLFLYYSPTNLKWSVIGGSGAGGGLDSWSTGIVYSIGDKVEINNRLYKALIAHTSGVFATDLAANNWIRLDNQADDLTGTVPIINGGTGAITFGAAFNNLSPISVSGDLVIGTGASTASRLAIGTETKNLKVVSGQVAWAEEDRSNLLVNPNFENSALTGWTCTTGTCTSTSTSGEFSEGLLGYKIALSAQAMNVSQSVATLAGSTLQYVVGVSYKVPSTLETFQICTLIAGAENTCVPSANLILDNTYHTIEIPEVITAGSTVGIKFKTSSDTGDAFIDKAYIKQGLGTQNLQLDNDYRAVVTTTSGTVTNPNKGTAWVTCTAANPTVCTFVTGIFTTTPNCIAGANINGGATTGKLSSLSSTGFTLETFLTSNLASTGSQSVEVSCQKSGNDYLAASSAVYSQASANYTETPATVAIPSGGITLAAAANCTHERNGGNLTVRCGGTATTSAALGEFTLPNSLSLDTSRIPHASTTSNPCYKVGTIKGNAASTYVSIVACTSTSTTVLYSANTELSAAHLTPVNVSTPLTTGQVVGVEFTVPISGWSNAATIVGSFENVPVVPNISRPVLVSAYVDASAVVTEDTSDFLQTCTDADPADCTLTTGFFASAPHCWANTNTAGAVASVNSLTPTSTTHVFIDRTDVSTAFTLFCKGNK